MLPRNSKLDNGAALTYFLRANVNWPIYFRTRIFYAVKLLALASFLTYTLHWSESSQSNSVGSPTNPPSRSVIRLSSLKSDI
jgi:hypothetical protein